MTQYNYIRRLYEAGPYLDIDGTSPVDTAYAKAVATVAAIKRECRPFLAQSAGRIVYRPLMNTWKDT